MTRKPLRKNEIEFHWYLIFAGMISYGSALVLMLEIYGTITQLDIFITMVLFVVIFLLWLIIRRCIDKYKRGLKK